MKLLHALIPLALVAVLAGCSSDTTTTSPGAAGASAADGTAAEGVLRVAYQDSPTGGIDPDVFYGVEGESIITSVYEGLVAYEPGGTEIGPALATSWEVSPDGRTYTFTLRQGVRFHDGAPFDAKAVKTNLERRMKLEQAVSYMLADVESIAAPKPDQLVVKLKRRNNAFLDLLASMYGPKIISPKALRQHAGGDDAQKWLAEHAVGTGPYKLDSYRTGESFKLSRNDDYWGAKASFPRVDIRVIPDLGTQRLQLSSGDIDLMTHGFDAAGLPSAERDPRLTVETFPAAMRHLLYLNTHKPPFDDPAVRKAFVAALDSDEAVKSVYGKTGRPAASSYPQMLSRDGTLGMLDEPPPAEPLDERVKVVMAYASGSGETGLLRLAQYLQSTLEKGGFDVTLKGDTYAQEFAYASDIQKAPNALLSGLNPDAAHPDAWATPVWTTGGGLNLLAYSNKEVDRLVAEARRADPDQADALYDQVAKTVERDAAVIPIDDFDDVIVARKGITGFEHTPLYIWQTRLSALKEE